jgi:predicted RNA-binding Zn ribbon-like protein
MAGENGVPVQPGGRPPAPGELALVQAFINSHYDLEFEHGADLLATRHGVSGWLARHDLIRRSHRVTGPEHLEVVEVREALRELARGEGENGLSAEARRALNLGWPVEIGLDAHGPRWQRIDGAGVRGALGFILAIAARAMIEGSWARLKVCPGEHCGWVFYDNSRNLSGRWCSMSVCGGRAKARAHYRRRHR